MWSTQRIATAWVAAPVALRRPTLRIIRVTVHSVRFLLRQHPLHKIQRPLSASGPRRRHYTAMRRCSFLMIVSALALGLFPSPSLCRYDWFLLFCDRASAPVLDAVSVAPS